MQFSKNIIEVKNLEIGLTKKKESLIVNNVSFSITRNKITALVGKSGSGKSIIARSILGLTNFIEELYVEGEIKLSEVDLLKMSESELQKIRGNMVSMVFQDTFSSLDPLKKCGEQISEIVKTNSIVESAEMEQFMNDLVIKLGIESRLYDLYPHQLSGGQLQRVGIAAALATRPKLLIADEPTTNLDASLKKGILDILVKIRKEFDITILFISHDLKAVKYIADEVVLLDEGVIEEINSSEEFFENPKSQIGKMLLSDYTNYLVKGSSRIQKEEVLVVEKLSKSFKTDSIFLLKTSKDSFKALQDINFTVTRGEILGVIGESGSGKTTLGRILMNLIPYNSGKVMLLGKEIVFGKHSPNFNNEIQIVFQNSINSLNPLFTLHSLLKEALLANVKVESNVNVDKEIFDLLNIVGLTEDILDKYPSEISGGEGQRIAIARALALEPKLLILDESISSLDRQAQFDILNLLLKLKRANDLTFLFISHDLLLSRQFCDKLMILKDGRIIEEGDVEDIFLNPKSDYTRELLSAIL